MTPPNVIERLPNVLGGTPVFAGTRVPVQALLDYLEGDQRIDDFLADYPTVTKEQAVAVLELAREMLTRRCAS
jgi:uncharacterized protein (DUF433 family)